jgi:hypothetical protein
MHVLFGGLYGSPGVSTLYLRRLVLSRCISACRLRIGLLRRPPLRSLSVAQSSVCIVAMVEWRSDVRECMTYLWHSTECAFEDVTFMCVLWTFEEEMSNCFNRNPLAAGVSQRQIRNSHWLRPMRPVRSGVIMDACRRESDFTRDRNFFDGVELSIERICM